MDVLVIPLKKPPDELTISVPGDKSIAHRALILAALASGVSVVENVPPNEDCLSTARVLGALGVSCMPNSQGTSVILGSGGRLQEPSGPLDCGNSGTTARLLAGVLAGQSFMATLDGDSSLRSRPMQRVARPLHAMGARITASEKSWTLPMSIEGTALKGTSIRLSSPSAQVKSAVLLAGLFADGLTTVIEPAHTRDHTERLLPLFGVELHSVGRSHSLMGGQKLKAARVTVPGDLSAAAFWMALGAAVPGLRVNLRNVSLNPTRITLVEVLLRMGAHVREEVISVGIDECWGNLDVRGDELRAIDLPLSLIPGLIDEIPILAVLAAKTRGTMSFSGVSDLRNKECDRINAVCTNLRKMGVEVEEQPDAFTVHGTGRFRPATLDSYGDHRIAMAFAIAGLLADGETIIRGAECVNISYPGFFREVLPQSFRCMDGSEQEIMEADEVEGDGRKLSLLSSG
ncbi:MAG: 3-phosphoshikimate 1-carboxyvinyltransferase [Verrucomicrobiaceae bacterium]|nr:MAG: 3-phosphoshikimate 1-carboxyvinyltransferase [Verrucomicrobiaceae bacterium]